MGGGFNEILAIEEINFVGASGGEGGSGDGSGDSRIIGLGGIFC